MIRRLDTQNQPIKDTSGKSPSAGHYLSFVLSPNIDFEKFKEKAQDGLKICKFSVLNSSSLQEYYTALLKESHLLCYHDDSKPQMPIIGEIQTHISPTRGWDFFNYLSDYFGKDNIRYHENKIMVVNANDPLYKNTQLSINHFSRGIYSKPERLQGRICKWSGVLHGIDRKILEDNKRLEDGFINIQNEYKNAASNSFPYILGPQRFMFLSAEIAAHAYPEHNSMAVCVTTNESTHHEQIVHSIQTLVYLEGTSILSNSTETRINPNSYSKKYIKPPAENAEISTNGVSLAI